MSQTKNTLVQIQNEDFDHNQLYQWLRCSEDKNSRFGAVITFTGIVRDFNARGAIHSIELEQYSPMTEIALTQLVGRARQRFALGRVAVVHRVGKLTASEQIVFVGVASEHRQKGFDAAEYIMDSLKAEIPLWKKEWFNEHESEWVKAKEADLNAAKRW